MTADIVEAAAVGAPTQRRVVSAEHNWRRVVTVGLIGGLIALYLCLTGLVPIFAPRSLIVGVISIGQTWLVLAAVAAAWAALGRAPGGRREHIAAATLAGALSGLVLTVLVLAGSVVPLRNVAVHASPDTYEILTFGLGVAGAWAPIAFLGAVGLATGVILTLPARFRRPITTGLAALLLVGLFGGFIRVPMIANPVTGVVARLLFGSEGITILGAVVTVVLVVGFQEANRRYHFRQRIAELPEERRRTLFWPTVVGGLLFAIVLPQAVGSFFAQVVAVVAIYILMGFGLNITLGLAGLLDLGFVAFFAVGAYTVGLLTSTAEYGIADWPFWYAVPFAVVLAMGFGAVLGLPILGIRGDYLAIATLGFGEIIRILAGSDLLKPFLGGPRGIVNIPKPIEVGPDSPLAGPLQIYYLAIVAAALVAFVALRLRDSRLGRAWLAIREDEDVAEALGINLVQTKLLAYMLGAAFAGLGGAINAGLIGSIFGSSIQFFISINVVALIIVGGLGSNPGVVVGAIFLIGLPELFREFSEYRLLFYGAALIAMMRFRPEGLLPSRITQRELHVPQAGDVGDPAAVPVSQATG